jgi:hypothetical protein
MKDNNILSIVARLGITVCVLLIGCSNTKPLNVRCRPLTDYEKIRMVDFRTMETVVFDSTQYKQYLLSFSDTTNNSSISGVFFVEKSYYFEKGLVLIVRNDSCKYEVIVITNNKKRVTSNKYYKMKITPYFYLKERTYKREVQNEIYHKHYVIYPAYLLRDEECICTANLEDIYEYTK